MNLIDKEANDPRSGDALRLFYQQRMVPVAEAVRASGGCLLPGGTGGPDDKQESWYVPYPDDAEEFATFEGSETGEGLKRLWESQGYAQLLALCEPLSDLAEELGAAAPEEDANVSPFIYVMF